MLGSSTTGAGAGFNSGSEAANKAAISSGLICLLGSSTTGAGAGSNSGSEAANKAAISSGLICLLGSSTTGTDSAGLDIVKVSTNSGISSGLSSISVAVVILTLSGEASLATGSASSPKNSVIASSLYEVSSIGGSVSTTGSLGSLNISSLIGSAYSVADKVFADILSATVVGWLIYCILLFEICLAISVIVWSCSLTAPIVN